MEEEIKKDELMGGKRELVAQMTDLDMLKNFRNQHLEKYISSEIFVKYYSEMCMPDDVIAITRESGDRTGLPNSVIDRKIKAKELRANEAKTNDRERGFLVVIDKLIEEAKKHAKND